MKFLLLFSLVASLTVTALDIIPPPDVTIVKDASSVTYADGTPKPNDENIITTAGDIVTFDITVENTGQVSFPAEQITVVDNMLGGILNRLPTGDQDLDPALDPGEIWIYRGTYTVQEEDLINSSLDNTADVTVGPYQYPFNPTASVPISPSSPQLSATKSVASVTGVDGSPNPDRVITAAGDVVVFEIRAESVGGVSLTGVTVVDPMLGGELDLAEGDTNFNGILDPGETWIYGGTYTVTDADLTNGGNLVNVATVTAENGNPNPVTFNPGTSVPIVPDPVNGSGGGDPHFSRWGQSRNTFHGECDLVLVHSDSFHNHAGLDVHVRTTIDTYYSYIESVAVRIGDYVLEVEHDQFLVNGEKFGKSDLPFTFGGDFQYKLEQIVDKKNVQTFQLDLHQQSSMVFKFYKHFLLISIAANPVDFAGAVGILGTFPTGEMHSRSGKVMKDFLDFGFEWQVSPEDKQLFQQARAPQLPYERCRLPTAGRSARHLRHADPVLTRQAETACAHVQQDYELCRSDILMTGDVGIAEHW